MLSKLRAWLGLADASTQRQELEEALDKSDPEADISPLERAMLRNVLALRQVKVGDVMVPRADIIAINIDVTLAETLKAFRSAGHSRLPVYSETLDDPRGMIHIRDFMSFIAAAPWPMPVRRMMRRSPSRLSISRCRSPMPGCSGLFCLCRPPCRHRPARQNAGDAHAHGTRH